MARTQEQLTTPLIATAVAFGLAACGTTTASPTFTEPHAGLPAAINFACPELPAVAQAIGRVLLVRRPWTDGATKYCTYLAANRRNANIHIDTSPTASLSQLRASDPPPYGWKVTELGADAYAEASPDGFCLLRAAGPDGAQWSITGSPAGACTNLYELIAKPH